MSNRAFYYVDGIPTKGLWIDMDLIDDEDEILEQLADAGLIPRETDEDDPDWVGDPEYGGDLLVADAEGLAKCFLGQYGTFDLEKFIEARDSRFGEEVVEAYLSCFDEWDEDDCADRYRGEFQSWEEMAEELLEETGQLSEIPESLRYYFDYEKYARDIRLGGDMCESNGHFFWSA